MSVKKKNKDNAIRIIVSIIYIVLGAGSVWDVLDALLAHNLVAVLTAAVGLIMFMAGIMGLCKLNPSVCRVFGVIIFICAAFTLVWAFLGKNYSGLMTPLVQTLIAWLFIVCL